MFNTIEDSIARASGAPSRGQRLLRYAAVLLLTGALFGALYMTIMLFE